MNKVLLGDVAVEHKEDMQRQQEWLSYRWAGTPDPGRDYIDCLG